MSRLLFSSFEVAPLFPVASPPLPFASAFEQALLAADRAAMSLLGGQPVVYAPAVGDPVTITGIFDAMYVLVKADTPLGVDALGPAVFLRIEDIPQDPDFEDPTLTIGSTDYKVSDRIPDGLGGIVLRLRTVG